MAIRSNSYGTESGRLKLLLVDDDKFTHELLGLFLRDSDFELSSAFSAEEAMRIIIDSPPDILITDAMMPGEGGFSLIDRIKARPNTARIPILLWTMLTQPDGSVMDASGKADILMNKPLYRSNMLESLERARQLIDYRSAVDDDVTVYVEQPTEHVEVIV